jgi:ferredoxin--NADP+ reductase
MSEQRYRSRVVSLRAVGPSAYELTIERQGLAFSAGQCLTLHGAIPQHDRSYTIASGERDEHLQIVFRLIPTGKLTPKLAMLKPGDEIGFSGPFGEFTVRDAAAPIVFVATGTGVAPCLAYLRTRPDLNISLVHGARYGCDLYYRAFFEQRPYFPCVSREAVTGAFKGRVTDFWATREWPKDSHYYLCGSNEMIFDMQVLLQKKGVPEHCIFTEPYYYRLYS